MKILKDSFSVTGLLAALVLATGCDQTKNVTAQKTAAAPNTLGLFATGKLCGLYVKFDKAVPGASPRSLTARASAEMCGTQGSTSGTWHAMGMTVGTAQVYVKKTSAATYDTSAAAQGDLLVTDANEVLVRQGGRTISVGTVGKQGYLEAIKPASGAAFVITIRAPASEDPARGERPYRIGDSKNTPDSDKHLFVITDL